MIELTLIPTAFESSMTDIYGLSIISSRMVIRFPVNLSPFILALFITFSITPWRFTFTFSLTFPLFTFTFSVTFTFTFSSFTFTFSVTFGTVIFRMNSSVLKDGTFAPLASCSRQIRSKPSAQFECSCSQKSGLPCELLFLVWSYHLILAI